MRSTRSILNDDKFQQSNVEIGAGMAKPGQGRGLQTSINARRPKVLAGLDSSIFAQQSARSKA
jgi:hypothetical protein